MTIDTGAIAPQVSLHDASEGDQHDLRGALERGPAVISVYKSSCEASKTMFHLLEQLRQAYPDPRLTIWGVAQDSANVTRSFIRRVGVSFPILVEGEGYPVSNAYDIEETPTVFLIDQGGEILWQSSGFQKSDLDELTDRIAGTLGAEVVDITAGVEDIPSFVPG